MRPITRRQAFQLGGLGAGSLAIGGTGLVWQYASRFDPVTGADLAEPELLRSRDGLLQVRLEASEGRLSVAGREATVYGYNASLPGPTLRLRPGDRLQMQLVNRLRTATNLHVHGLHVSPQDNGDNVFLSVEPGESFDYDYQLPDDHPPGCTGTTPTTTAWSPTRSSGASTAPSSSRNPSRSRSPANGCWWFRTSPSTGPGRSYSRQR